MGSKKIVVSKATLDEKNRQKIDQVAGRYGYTVEYFRNNKDAVEALADAEIAYGMGPKLVKHAPQLKWFCSAAAGVNNILIDGLIASPDAQITCATGAYGITIAEHTVCALLMLMRRIPEYEEVLDKHFYDSLLLYDRKLEGIIADVGTGAGFPGVVLKIVIPDLKVVLLEPIGKRCTFLRSLIEKLDLKDIDVIQER